MGNLIIGGTIIALCSNCTIAKIVASTGIVLHICKIQKGRDIAVGSGVMYTIAEIIKVVL
ncbi:MAG: hypothetical protein K0S71_637 [Clostridia bacterium]|jgi:hypothetical protein|nr:hypothetical protein [Clostridia bacterium]